MGMKCRVFALDLMTFAVYFQLRKKLNFFRSFLKKGVDKRDCL